MNGIKGDSHATDHDRDHDRDRGTEGNRASLDERMRKVREEISGGTIMPDGNSSPGPIPPDTW